MPLIQLFSRRLYLRIWLAVVGGVAVLTLLVGWAWRVAAEQNAQPLVSQGREMVLRDSAGNTLVAGLATRTPSEPDEGLELRIDSDNGQHYSLHIAPRPLHNERSEHGERSRRGEPNAAFWMRPPFGFVWMLGLVGLAVAVGVFPIIRRLLKRLDVLQRSVQRFGEGDLAARVPVQGHDEVADLSRQFNAAAGRIQTLVQSHKSLLANASHELRSPLTRIRMGLELMGASSQPSPAFRDEILRNIAELDQLVDEILLASRLDAHEADVGTIELVDMVGLAAEECARVDADLDAGADTLEVRGVAKLLRRAVRNLLENARRYSQGDITVSLRRSPSASSAAQMTNMVQVRVCDHGPGVPEALRERIFEPFYRLPGASERAGGVGLGLALVRSIASRHGGRVYCQDRSDGSHGACFVLELPLRGIDGAVHC
jgi:two-component system OmpR family sensor kinase